MSCDVGKAREGLENELWRRLSDWKLGEWAELIVIVIAELNFQAFNHFTYVTAHSDSPSFPSLHLHHSSFSNPSLALPTSQLIIQPFRCFTYVTAHSPTILSPLLRHRFSLTSPGEPPMTLILLIPPPRQNNYLRPWPMERVPILIRQPFDTDTPASYKNSVNICKISCLYEICHVLMSIAS